MICRQPAREERTQINRALDRWGAFEFFKHKPLIIQEVGTKKKIVCLVTGGIEKAIQVMEDPYSAGLAIGELKKQFIPSIAGADLFARYGKRNKYYITVGEKAENLVLYGRDIMGESIEAASDALDENELVIVLNTAFEAIAVGRTRFAGRSLFQKGRVTVSTIADAGYYLREEG
ncbi:MAG TPA: NIP7 N-terminal domain-related protein [Nitrososphaera sp.]|nr:NIP7 N-terminal domain-related protein [Nitrososphaera sp.]